MKQIVSISLDEKVKIKLMEIMAEEAARGMHYSFSGLIQHILADALGIPREEIKIRRARKDSSRLPEEWRVAAKARDGYANDRALLAFFESNNEEEKEIMLRGELGPKIRELLRMKKEGLI